MIDSSGVSRLVRLLAVAFLVLWAASPGTAAAGQRRLGAASVAATHLYNMDYSTGTIEVYGIGPGGAVLEHSFNVVRVKNGGVGGLAVDRYGVVYTAVDASSGHPCSACFEAFEPDGTLLAQVAAPTLPGATNPPDLTDISVDNAGDVFLSDYGQQAVYAFAPSPKGFVGPAIVVEGTTNAASVAATPNGRVVFVSGGCGFASVRPYTLQTSVGYASGNCFGIGTIALIGGAVDNQGTVFTPVDGALGIVSMSDAAGRGRAFAVPDRKGEIGGVALSGDGSFLYVSDHHHERVYVYQRPAQGWLSRTGPILVAEYTGFANLDVIAVSP